MYQFISPLKEGGDINKPQNLKISLTEEKKSKENLLVFDENLERIRQANNSQKNMLFAISTELQQLKSQKKNEVVEIQRENNELKEKLQILQQQINKKDILNQDSMDAYVQQIQLLKDKCIEETQQRLKVYDLLETLQESNKTLFEDKKKLEMTAALVKVNLEQKAARLESQLATMYSKLAASENDKREISQKYLNANRGSMESQLKDLENELRRLDIENGVLRNEGFNLKRQAAEKGRKADSFQLDVIQKQAQVETYAKSIDSLNDKVNALQEECILKQQYEEQNRKLIIKDEQNCSLIQQLQQQRDEQMQQLAESQEQIEKLQQKLIKMEQILFELEQILQKSETNREHTHQLESQLQEKNKYIQELETKMNIINQQNRLEAIRSKEFQQASQDLNVGMVYTHSHKKSMNLQDISLIMKSIKIDIKEFKKENDSDNNQQLSQSQSQSQQILQQRSESKKQLLHNKQKSYQFEQYHQSSIQEDKIDNSNKQIMINNNHFTLQQLQFQEQKNKEEDSNSYLFQEYQQQQQQQYESMSSSTKRLNNQSPFVIEKIQKREYEEEEQIEAEDGGGDGDGIEQEILKNMESEDLSEFENS